MSTSQSTILRSSIDSGDKAYIRFDKELPQSTILCTPEMPDNCRYYRVQ